MNKTISGEISLEKFTKFHLKYFTHDYPPKKIKDYLEENENIKFLHIMTYNKPKKDSTELYKGIEVKVSKFIYNGDIFLNNRLVPLFHQRGDVKWFNMTELYFLDGINKKDEDLLLKKIKENMKYLHVRIK